MSTRFAFGCAVALTLSPAAASAQVVTWYWTISDTGNTDGVIEPSESALLRLWAGFEPRQDQLGGGFYATDPYSYDVLGNSAWSQGAIDQHRNLLDGLAAGDGEIDDANNILGILNFQFPMWRQD